jgi:hypothetical protein
MRMGKAFLTLVTVAGWSFSCGAASPPPKEVKPQERAEATTRLKLIDIEARIALDGYERGVKHVLDLRENVRALLRIQATPQNQQRLADAQLALQDTEQDVKEAREKLVRLELERTRLLHRLGRKGGAEAVPTLADRLQRSLDQILERVASIEKRLERLERR